MNPTRYNMEELCFSFITRNRYYACLLSKLIKVADPKQKTAGVGFTKNGRPILIYNEEFFAALTLSEGQAVLEHEVLHLVLKHLERIPFTPDKSLNVIKNIACDIAINQYIKGLPKCALYPKDFKFEEGKSAEEYLELLLKKDEEKKQGGQGESQEDGQKGQDKEQQPLDSHEGWNKIFDEGEIRDQQEGDECDAEYEVAKIVKQTAKECEDYINRELELSKQGKNSKLPLAILKELHLTLHPVKKHAWEKELQLFVNTVLTTETRLSYKRMNRRIRDKDYVLPAKKQNRKPKLLLARDTSGSVFNDKMQELFLMEMLSISKFCEVHVCDCDEVIHQTYPVVKIQDFRSYKGGGATSFIPVFEEAKRLKVDGIIYLTDTQGTFPKIQDIKFANKTIWVTMNQKEVHVPFGKHVNITDAK